MDGPAVPGAGRDGRRDPERDAARRPHCRLRLRHHVRDELGVRLRLPSRQPGGRPRVVRAARALLRDRRRGRLDPDRRGADAADHLRPARGGGCDVLRVRPHRQAAACAGGLRDRREAQDRRTDRGRRAQGRAGARHRQPLLARQRAPGEPHDPGAQGRVAVPPRRRVRGARGRGQDRRRVHGPHDGGPPLVGGSAPGRRGQGGREDRGREHHGRDRHDPELLPHVREARRHDGHRLHRGERVRGDLQARGGVDTDQRLDDPPGQQRRRVQDAGREVRGGRRRHRRPAQEGPAGARRHDLDRGLRDALRACWSIAGCRTTC